MIVVAPGIAARSIAERVHTVDLAPTVAALAGLPVPADVDGVDRSGALRASPAGSASAPAPAEKP
jgi:arylsulfatase A-like enzyme